MTESTDKWEDYKLPYGTNEEHPPEEFDPEQDAELNNPKNRHRDKLLDKLCDDHPGTPMCKVFDE